MLLVYSFLESVVESGFLNLKNITKKKAFKNQFILCLVGVIRSKALYNLVDIRLNIYVQYLHEACLISLPRVGICEMVW